jgi:hypothetical protein
MPVADGYITNMSLTPEGVMFVSRGNWYRHADQLYNFDTTTKDSEQGNLAYDPGATTDTFQDDGQDFSDWEPSGPTAEYEISIVNADGTITYAFIGSAFTTTNSNDSINVYTDYELNTSGWNGDSPSGKTPSSYTISLVYDAKTTSEVIKEALTDEVPVLSSDQSNIDETNTVIGGWETPIEEGGMYPSVFIEKMASFSDTSNRQWNYWVANQRFDVTSPQKGVPHFEAQVNSGSFDWDIENWMISAGNPMATRSIEEMRNHVRIIYRDMEDDDLITITDAAQDNDSQDKYWRREAVVSGGDAVPSVAEKYRDLYLNKFKDALMAEPIVISAPYILRRSGARVPLWTPIKESKSYFRLSELFPSLDLFDSSWDRLRSGQAMSMEYESVSNTLRVHLDQESNELDALIARMDAWR